ncbi:MAG: hypothetical protein ABIO99_06230 [Candidatus Limnocylindria bacterium]
MSERSDHLADDAIAQFLRTRSADPDLGLLDDIVRAAGATSQDRPWLGLRPILLPRRTLLIVASALLLAAMGAIGVGSRLLQPDPLVTTFGGTWISTSDADGGTQTMSVRASADGAVDITVLDTIATVCSGTPSTMTGTGAIEGGTQLVIPAPVYACDDGSQPQALSGPPLQEQLRNWTLALDPQTGTLTDSVVGIWYREGAAVPSPDSSTQPTISDTMWPQKSLEEVREAQELADAGDPDHTWQVDALLAGDESAKWERLYNGQVEVVDRFLREVLGWEAYMQNVLVGGADYALTDQQFLRCAPGRTNPLYPPQPDSEEAGESCAPTLDALTYESVSLDLVQPDRQGPGGIWVVSNWRPTTFAQADPAVAEAQATERLEEFLVARIAGRGADGYVDVYADWLGQEVPLLYATTSGAPYERSEFERVDGPRWPYGGHITFSVRLFADGGATVVEQPIYSHWDGGRSVGIEGGLALEGTTTENGEPVPMTFGRFDGEVTYSSTSTYSWSFGGDAFIDFADPVVPWSECAQSPVPTDATGFAQAVAADPRFETTAPVATRVGGFEAVSMDVALAPNDRFCLAAGFGNDSYYSLGQESGLRLRLYLVDVPEGMSMQTLLITVMAAEEKFEEVIGDAQPIIDSIEFHPR